MHKLNIEELSGRRERLASKVPLVVPYKITIDVAHPCNLKCEFCEPSNTSQKRGIHNFIDTNIIIRFVDELKDSKVLLKQIMLGGSGEPLLHKDISQIVGFLSGKTGKRISKKVVIVSNGTLLDEKLSRELIENQLDEMRISINGLSDEDYFCHTRVKIDFQKLVKEIKRFYELSRNTNTKLYIKIIDYMLDSKEKENAFYEIFGPICDVINIEHLIRTSEKIEYESISSNNEYGYSKSVKGYELSKSNICPRSFFEASINSDGTISPCCYATWLWPPVLVQGDLKKESFMDIWNSKQFNSFRLKMLEGVDAAGEICKKCVIWRSMAIEEDNIDDVAEDLKKYYKGEV